MVGTLQQMETASYPGREELLKFGMVLAVCSRLGLCVSLRRGPGCFGLRSSALGSLILHVLPSLPSLRLEHPSLSGYCVDCTLFFLDGKLQSRFSIYMQPVSLPPAG